MWSGLTNKDIRSDDRTVKLKPSEIDYVEKTIFNFSNWFICEHSAFYMVRRQAKYYYKIVFLDIKLRIRSKPERYSKKKVSPRE